MGLGSEWLEGQRRPTFSRNRSDHRRSMEGGGLGGRHQLARCLFAAKLGFRRWSALEKGEGMSILNQQRQKPGSRRLQTGIERHLVELTHPLPPRSTKCLPRFLGYRKLELRGTSRQNLRTKQADAVPQGMVKQQSAGSTRRVQRHPRQRGLTGRAGHLNLPEGRRKLLVGTRSHLVQGVRDEQRRAGASAERWLERKGRA